MRDQLVLFVCSVVCAASIACGDDDATESKAHMRADAAAGDEAGAGGSNGGSAGKGRTAGAGGLVLDAGIGGAGGSAHGSGGSGELSDNEIAAVLNVLNTVQLELGKALSQRALTPLARDYARMMLSEYAGNQERQNGIFQRLGIHPTEGAVSAQLEREARRVQSAVDGAAQDVDLVYMQLQVELQREVLRLLAEKLAPSAMHHTLQTELTRIRVQLQQSIALATPLIETLSFSGRTEDAGVAR